MTTAEAQRAAQPAALTDDEIVARVRSGDIGLYEILMRRHNQRLYRAVRAILRDEAESEDVLQDAYLDAYRHLDSYSGRARFSTWLVRIAVNKALDRRRRRVRVVALNPESEVDFPEDTTGGLWSRHADSPEEQSARREFVQILEEAIDTLSESTRSVYMLRDVEGMNTLETAETLGIEAATVKTRLHRARAQLRDRLTRDFDVAALQAFPFGAERCDRLVSAVLERLVRDAR